MKCYSGPYKPGDHFEGIQEPWAEIIEDSGVLKTRGCEVCNGTHSVNGAPCPRCFDPARYDYPEDGIPYNGHVAVAQGSDIPEHVGAVWASPEDHQRYANLFVHP